MSVEDTIPVRDAGEAYVSAIGSSRSQSSRNNVAILTRPRLPAVLLALALCGPNTPGAQQAEPAAPRVPDPPRTRRDDVKETLHGVELIDPYRWLEDQEAPETRAFIDAQNAYAHSLLDPLPSLGAIRERLTILSRQDIQRAPTERGGRYFTLRREAGDDLPRLFVREQLSAADAVLLDPHPLSADHTTSVTVEDISLDGRLLVYGVRTSGEDETELRTRDVVTRKDLPDRLARALYRGVSLRPGERLLLCQTGSRQGRPHSLPCDGDAGCARP